MEIDKKPIQKEYKPDRNKSVRLIYCQKTIINLKFYDSHIDLFIT